MDIPAHELAQGDVVRLKVGWRNVLDVRTSLGFVHAVASDSTGMWEAGELVEVGRRGRPSTPLAVSPPRHEAHVRGDDCGHLHCVACWRAGRRSTPVRAGA